MRGGAEESMKTREIFNQNKETTLLELLFLSYSLYKKITEAG
jgi:hypothetical protein